MQFNSCKPTAPDPLLASSKQGKIIEYSQMSIKILCTEVSKSMNKMNHDAYGSKFKMKVKYGSYIHNVWGILRSREVGREVGVC